MSNADLNLNTDRIGQLERKMKWVVACSLVLPVCTFLLGAAASDVMKTKSLVTERLVVTDADGKERLAIYCSDVKEPVIEMYHADHSLILNAGKSPENGVGFMQFFDSAGNFKAGVGGNSVK